ncbi:hypothetical protein T069G_08773 [Trichoderma breve]|uniref:Uncharacterized protein n=1 Tax=Trichoderma breve TaxID=2034170 RepID=A0A9W9BE36_9HYPO|nr:hypothetical protein T069G_08773 [Trichoderma breve]KAJ4857876.1 hypothetical protein T069G_08773 [Trichoderma breve]
MRFTTAVVSILVGSAFAAPTEMSAEMKTDTASDMSADAIAALSHMHLSDIFSERQLAVIKVLSKHKHELGLNDKEAEMMDTFMGALHETFHLNDKRQIATDAAGNATNTVTGALGNPGGVIDPLNVTNTNATTGAVGTTIANATTGALAGSTALLDILKSIPALGALLAGTTGGLGGATSGLTGAASGLGGLTGGLGESTGGLGGLTGGLGGLTGGLGGLTGSLGGLGSLGLLCPRSGGLLGGILIPGIL